MDKTELINKLKEVVRDKYNGNPPTYDALKEHNSSLGWFITKYGGYIHIKKLCGFDVIERKSHNYWKNWDNFSKEINPLITNNTFPTLNFIQSNIGTSACKAIYKMGGIKKVADKLGCKFQPNSVTSDGHNVQSSYEYLFDEFLSHNKIPHEVGGFIVKGHKYRYDFKIGNNYIEIWGFSKNKKGKASKLYNKNRCKKERLYKKLGLKLISIEAEDVFKRKENEVKEYLEKIILEFGNYPTTPFPIQNYIHHVEYWNEEKIIEEIGNLIKKLGYFPNCKDLESVRGLEFAFYKYGSRQKFIKKFPNVKIIKLKHDIWTEESLIDELKKITEQLGHFPTSNELKKNKKTGMMDAIWRLGKINKYRQALGYKPVKVSDNYWTEELILEEMLKIKKELGRNPKTQDLMKTPIHSAIHKTKKGIRYYINKI